MSDVRFELKVVDRQRMADPESAKRRADRENGRQQAQQFASEALLIAVNIMRTSKDPTQVLKAAKMVMDRAWGIPKSAEDEEQDARSKSIIELLASMSMEISASGCEQPAIRHEEHDVPSAVGMDLSHFLSRDTGDA